MDKDKIFPSIVIAICIITTFMVSSLDEKISSGFKIDPQAFLVLKRELKEEVVSEINRAIGLSSGFKIDPQSLSVLKGELKEEVVSEIKRDIDSVSQRTEAMLNNIEHRFGAINISEGADLKGETPVIPSSLGASFEANTIAEMAVNKSFEQLEAGKFADAFLYLKNGIETKLTDWKSLDKIVAKIDSISKDEKLSPEQKFVVLSDWLDFLSKKFYYIMPEDLPSWKDALLTANTQIRALNIDETDREEESLSKILATDTRLILSIVNKPVSSAKEAETQLEKLTSVVAGRELPTELEKHVKPWIEQCLAFIQSENIYKEFAQTLQEYIETDREFLLNSAHNLLASYGEVYKTARRKNWNIKDIASLESELAEAKKQRDMNYFEEKIQPLMAELRNIASGMFENHAERVSQMENILQQLALFYQKLNDSNEKVFLKDFQEAKALYDEAIIDLYEFKIEAIKKPYYNTHQKRIESYQAFLSEPGDLLAKITNEESKNRFSKTVDDLKHDLMCTLKKQNDEYQKKALNYIQRAHKKYSEFYTSIGKQEEYKKILEYELGDIDTNILNFEVRKAYEEVFAEMYSVLSTEQKLSLSSNFLDKKKIELKDL